MLWVDRVGNRRSETILAPNFSEKTGDQHKKTENGQERKNWFHVRGTERRISKVSGVIVISDFIHIAGIRNQESFCFVNNK